MITRLLKEKEKRFGSDIPLEKVQLHPHQHKAVRAIMFEWGRPKGKRTLCISPTGSGKTVIGCAAFAEGRRRFFPDKERVRCLFLSHTTKIATQTKERMLDMFPELGSIGVVYGDVKEWDKDAVCATVQSLNNYDAMQRLHKQGKFDFVITDETHRVVASTHQNVIDMIVERNKQARFLGLTATYERGDKRGLVEVYKTVAHQIPLDYLVKRGFVAKPVIHGFKQPVSGAANYSHPTNVKHVYRRWFKIQRQARRKEGKPIRSLFFSSQIEDAQNYSRFFQSQGVNAVVITGEDSMRMRHFYEENSDVIFSVDVYTEGADLQDVGIVGILSPTNVQSRYIQRAGRALRPDTKEAHILDFFPTRKAHSLEIKIGDKYVLGNKIRGERKAVRSKLGDMSYPSPTPHQQRKDRLEASRNKPLDVDDEETERLIALFKREVNNDIPVRS